MNRESILNYLLKLLSTFKYHSNMLAEVIDILANSGAERQFFTQLVTRLRQLSSRGVLATQFDGFEPIEQSIYSMKFKASSYNIRILYGFLPSAEPVLLLAFYERWGKRCTSYAPQIATAVSRLNEIREDSDNGI